MKYFICVLVFLLVFAIPIVAGPNIGDPCPDFYKPDTTYTYHRLSDYQGNVVFLNLGQSW